jgi:hypothetical protein
VSFETLKVGASLGSAGSWKTLEFTKKLMNIKPK